MTDYEERYAMIELIWMVVLLMIILIIWKPLSCAVLLAFFMLMMLIQAKPLNLPKRALRNSGLAKSVF